MQEEDWQLSFQVSQEAETLSAPLHLTKVRQWNEKSCDITYEKVTLNYLGLDLWGQALEQETGNDMGAVTYPFPAAIVLQNGETIPLREKGCSTLASWQTEDIGFVQRYGIDPEQSNLKMIDLKQVAYLLLDGEKITLTQE